MKMKITLLIALCVVSTALLGSMGLNYAFFTGKLQFSQQAAAMHDLYSMADETPLAAPVTHSSAAKHHH